MARDKKTKTPWLANFLLSKVTADKLHEEFLGDLAEVYEERVDKKGKVYASLMYWIDVFHLLIGFSSSKLFKTKGRQIALTHYIKIAFRNIFRKKAYAFTNIVSLAIGMGVCLVIFQYVYFELSYDSFHKNHENTYRVIVDQKIGDAWEIYPDAIGYSFGQEAAETIPEIKRFVRKERVNRTAVITNPQSNSVFYEQVNNLFFVDPAFFEMFNFPLLTGNPSSLFADKYNIAITEATARKYFGDADPMGKTLKISGPPSPGNYTVTGVLRDIPLNTHMQFDFLMPMDNYIDHGWGGAVKKNGGWGGFSVVTYFQVNESADLKLIQDKLNALIVENTPEDLASNKSVKQVTLQPVADIYMKSGDLSYPGHFNSTGNFQTILVFSFISLVIILIAWVNYINLATAQSIQRAKEVGIRKSLGAQKKQLIIQFMVEAVLFNLAAAGLAIGLGFLLLPVLNQIIGKELELSLIHLPTFWPMVIGIVALGSLLSGIYPAFVMSGFKPLSMLKGHTTGRKTLVLRQGLIVFQFLTSLLLLSATYLVVRQTAFMKNQDLGIDLNKILVLSGPRVSEDRAEAISKFQTFRDELANHPSVHSVTGSLFVPGQFWTARYQRPESSEVNTLISRGFYTTLNFENTYDLEFIAGGPFTKNMPDEKSLIINEAALSAFGFKSAEDAINQKLKGENGDRLETIVGVVRNFHWHSLHEGHTPYVIELYENRLTENISIKLSTNDLSQTLKHVEASFQSFFPGNPFDYYFANAAFDKEYQAEDQFSTIFLCFTLLAIFIACVGLLALVSHSFSLRIKEIGIRKVLGAGAPRLMLLLSKEYLRLILIAIMLTAPLIWYVGSSWLENYSYRINMSVDLFIYPAIILFLITVITVIRRTFLASRANPVDSLRMD